MAYVPGIDDIGIKVKIKKPKIKIKNPLKAIKKALPVVSTAVGVPVPPQTTKVLDKVSFKKKKKTKPTQPTQPTQPSQPAQPTEATQPAPQETKPTKFMGIDNKVLMYGGVGLGVLLILLLSKR